MKPVALLIPLLAVAACARPPTAQDGSGERGAGTAPGAAATQPAMPAPAPAPAAASKPAAGSAPAGEAGALARVDGFGTLRFGMTVEQARAAFEGDLEGDAIAMDNCGYLAPKADGEFRTGFMFEGGAFVRYDVAVADIVAPGGGRVGQARADIERLYAGRVQVQPHEYVAGGKYLRVTDPGAPDRALVFETDEAGKVTRWRVGRAPQVDYVEGCA